MKGLDFLTPDDIFSRLYPSNDNSDSKEQSEVVLQNPAPFPKETPLAMSYIYFQQWGETLNPDTALEKGTLFPCLDKPFERGADSGK